MTTKIPDAQKADEIEVTPEMIEAGIGVLYKHCNFADAIDFTEPDQTARLLGEAFTRMRASRP